jgi:hypothetical protein
LQKYGNISGDSGVRAFEIRPDSIAVQFASGVTYVYSVASAGAANIERMKTLARAGRGLSTFIATHVHDAYASKS